MAEGTVGLLGVSSHWAWQVERARALAAAAGLPGYEVLQYQHSYLRPRTDLPGSRSPDGIPGMADGDLLSYLRAELRLAMVAYASLMRGGYVLAWLIGGDIPVVGASSVAQLDENLAAVDLKTDHRTTHQARHGPLTWRQAPAHSGPP